MTAVATVTAVTATVWAAVRDCIMWNVAQGVWMLMSQAVQREMWMIVVADAVVPQAVEVLVTQAIQRVVSQRVAVVRVGAVTTLGSRVGYRSSSQFIGRKCFLLAGVSDESQYGNKKQRLFHENW